MINIPVSPRALEVLAYAEREDRTADEIAIEIAGSKKWADWQRVRSVRYLGLIEDKPLGPEGGKRVVLTPLGRRVLRLIETEEPAVQVRGPRGYTVSIDE